MSPSNALTTGDLAWTNRPGWGCGYNSGTTRSPFVMSQRATSQKSFHACATFPSPRVESAQTDPSSKQITRYQDNVISPAAIPGEPSGMSLGGGLCFFFLLHLADNCPTSKQSDGGSVFVFLLNDSRFTASDTCPHFEREGGRGGVG